MARKEDSLQALRVFSDLVIPVYQQLPPPIAGLMGAIAYLSTDAIPYFCDGVRWLPLDASGSQGFQGAQGFQGGAGAQGFQGGQGGAGAQGVQGFQGGAGTQGAQGGAGSQGFQGFQGALGFQGFQGASGTQIINGTGNQIDATTLGNTTTLSLTAPVILPGDLQIPAANLSVAGWEVLGSVLPPPNTTPGDFTGIRLALSNNGNAAIVTNSTLYINSTNNLSTNFVNVNATAANTGGTDYRCAQFTMTNTGATSLFGNYICSQNVLIHDSGTSIVNIHCVNSLPSTTANFTAGNISQLNGFRTSPVHQGAGTIGTLNGFFFQQGAATGGTITNYNGINIGAISTTSATNSAALKIDGVTGATVNNYAIWINSNTNAKGSGLVLGTAGDAWMARGAANQLSTPGDWSSRHYLSTSVPVAAAGAGAGTGAGAVISGTDHGFVVTLTTGTGATANATLFTVTFGTAWTTAAAPSATWSPGNSATVTLYDVAGKVPYISGVTTAAVTVTSGTTALTDATVYVFRFTVM